MSHLETRTLKLFFLILSIIPQNEVDISLEMTLNE